ncbi:MAG TPA: hypothetical protein VMY98_01615 [Anaerolineae bacterium]|nr:hypothetical protein [Anaerolineae bacterium]
MSRRESALKRLAALFEFSLKSLLRPYGRLFVRRVALRHPLRTVRALWTYCLTFGASPPEHRLFFRGDEEAFVGRAAADGERLLVGTGFCQKPRRLNGKGYDCPVGRFNHDCLYLSRLELDSGGGLTLHPACFDCPVRVLGQAALEAGASFVLLTSALDIAHDILLPALEEKRVGRVLFAVCPYSVEPMTLALLVCGVEGCIFDYHNGFCTNYTQWLRADGGDKPERTTLSPPDSARLIGLLKSIAARRFSSGSARPRRYAQVGHVFRPS